MKLIIKIFLFAILTCFGCSINELNEKVDAQNYLFEAEYLNGAWGYQHHGFYIDNTGSVYKYKFNFDERSVECDPFFCSQNVLTEKYAHNREFCGSVDLGVLETKKRLIKFTLNSQYSDTLNLGADMGQLSYFAYSWDEDEEKYLRILLKTMGDVTYKMEGAAVDSIINWMDTLCLQELE